MLIFINHVFLRLPFAARSIASGSAAEGEAGVRPGACTPHSTPSKVWGRYVSIAQVSMKFQGSACATASKARHRSGLGSTPYWSFFWREPNMPPVRHPA